MATLFLCTNFTIVKLNVTWEKKITFPLPITRSGLDANCWWITVKQQPFTWFKHQHIKFNSIMVLVSYIRLKLIPAMLSLQIRANLTAKASSSRTRLLRFRVRLTCLQNAHTHQCSHTSQPLSTNRPLLMPGQADPKSFSNYWKPQQK